MKKLTNILTAIALWIAFSTTVHAQEVLTNQDLIQLAKMGMGDAILLSKIKNANNDFDASTAALMALKAAGIGDAVLAEVITAANDPARKTVDANDPLAPHKPGVYYQDESGQLVELLPAVTSQNKDKGRITNILSQGWAKTTAISTLSGATARAQFYTPPPFYFYFNQQNVRFEQSSIGYYGFVQATSPNEFTLAKLDETGSNRELEIGAYSNIGSESGISEKHSKPFEIEQVAPGVFKVTPSSLPTGEYCFVYAGSAPAAGSLQRVFDFGVN